jgi:hypothetical protein
MTVVAPEYPGWRALEGFGVWEGPYEQWRLPRCRWAMGPGGKMEVCVAEGGKYRLMIECINTERGQRISALVGGTCVGQVEVPAAPAPASHVVWFDMELQDGANVVELRHAKWTVPAGSERRLAVLFVRVACVRWER